MGALVVLLLLLALVVAMAVGFLIIGWSLKTLVEIARDIWRDQP